MFPLPNFIRRLGRFRPERGALLMFPMIWTSGCDPIEETIRPVSDVQFTNWATFGGPSAAWDALDDEGDDTDGIQGTSPGSAVCGSTDAIDFEVHLDDPTNRPGSSQCQGMRFDNRVSDETDFGEVEGCVDWVMEVLQGGTNIATHNFSDVGLAIVLNTFALTDADVDQITDHTDLRTKGTANIGARDAKTTAPTSLVHYSGIDYFKL